MPDQASREYPPLAKKGLELFTDGNAYDAIKQEPWKTAAAEHTGPLPTLKMTADEKLKHSVQRMDERLSAQAMVQRTAGKSTQKAHMKELNYLASPNKSESDRIGNIERSLLKAEREETGKANLSTEVLSTIKTKATGMAKKAHKAKIKRIKQEYPLEKFAEELEAARIVADGGAAAGGGGGGGAAAGKEGGRRKRTRRKRTRKRTRRKHTRRKRSRRKRSNRRC